MKYEAIESFSGIVSMTVGEVREIPNDALAKDLIKAKLIKKYVADDAKVIKEELEKANKTIEELTLENTKLKAELESLKTQPVDAGNENNNDKDDNSLTDKEETEKNKK